MTELTLFPHLSPQGLMYLQLPMRDPRLSKTDIKLGFSRDRATQRRRDRAHSKASPAMTTVATWRATHEHELAFHARNKDDVMPGKREWYFPTLRVIRGIRAEMSDAIAANTIAFQPGWCMESALEHLHRLFTAYDRHLFLMIYGEAQNG